MSGYRVRAIDSKGVEHDIFIDAGSKQDAATKIRARGLTPISAKPGTPLRKKRPPRGANAAAARIVRELGALTGAGLTVEQALSSLSRYVSSSLMQTVAQSLREDVRSGMSLADAFSARPEIFPPPFPQIAEAGEVSGALSAALNDLADWQERRANFDGEIKGALIYPVILLVLAFVAVTGLLIFVVPRFEQVFADMGAAPPAFAAGVFATGRWLAKAGPFILAIGVGASFLTGLWLKGLEARRSAYAFAHRLPGLGPLLRSMLAARFCRVLAVLLQNGLSAVPSFRLASASLSDDYAKMRLEEALTEVRRGASLPDEIAKTGVLPPLAVEIIRVGEQTGELGKATERLATLLENRLERGARTALHLAEPALIGFVGLIVGVIIVSILLALVSVNDIGI
jgi:general secretion pathway protein F